jgi:hypothetical protein
MSMQSGVVNSYLAAVHRHVSPQWSNPPFLFTTFFLSQLIGPRPPPVKSSVGSLMRLINYMALQKYAILLESMKIQIAPDHWVRSLNRNQTKWQSSWQKSSYT